MTIDENCLDSNKQLTEFDLYSDPLNSDWQVFLDRNVNDVQFENNIQEIIQNAYLNSNKFLAYGFIACIYFISAVSTFLAGLASFFEKKQEE